MRMSVVSHGLSQRRWCSEQRAVSAVGLWWASRWRNGSGENGVEGEGLM